MAKNLFRSVLIFCLTACASPGLKVQTEPSEAVVTYIENGNEKNLGLSPLTIKNEDIDNIDKKGFKLRFEKPGFLKEQITLDARYFRKVGEVQVKLTPLANWSGASQDPQANRYLNDVASMSAEIQALTVKKEFNQAENLAKSLVTRYPKLSVAWTLIGNIYYLQRRVGDAISAYTKALDINPEDQETKRILNQLKGSTF